MKLAEPSNTDRLRLRKLSIDDAELMLAVWNDPAFVRFVGDRGIRTIDDARDAMEKGAMKLYEDYGYGPYRMSLKDCDTAIGICGLFRRDGLEEPDIGYATLPEYCGQGFAYEACCAVVDHANIALAIDRLIAIISPKNDASIGLIRKLGFEFERMHKMPGDDNDVSIYGKSLNTWEM